MTAVVLSPLAESDLEDIADYIAADNPRRALSFVDELLDQCAKIAQFPQGHPSRDDLAPGLRMASHGRYLIFYNVLDADIRIERILHSARNLAALFETG